MELLTNSTSPKSQNNKMKRTASTLLLILLFFVSLYASDTYDIAQVYEKQELPRDAKILDNYDNIKEAKYILLPAQLERGNYEITVTRIDTNIYRVERTDFIIETKYCYEYSHYQKAILMYENSYGYSKGKLVFVK